MTEFEITPEPTPSEREALTQALERLLADKALPPVYRSAWRVAGIRENVGGDEPYATARPRRTPGASRA